MGNELINFNSNELIEKKMRYKQCGSNEELGLIYMENEKNYIVDDIFSDDSKIKISGELVNNLVEKTNTELGEILDLLYYINSSFISYNTKSLRFFTASPTVEMKGDLEKIEEALTFLIEKHGYGPVFAYFKEAGDGRIVELFKKSRKAGKIDEISELDGIESDGFIELDEILEEFSMADQNGYNERYDEEYPEFATPVNVHFPNRGTNFDSEEDETTSEKQIVRVGK